MFDYLRTMPVEDISGRGDRGFNASSWWGGRVAGELEVKLSSTHRIKLSHIVIRGCPTPDGGHLDNEHRPTAVWINDASREQRTFALSDARKIHWAIGGRIQDLREDTEHRLAILNAEILREDRQPQWTRLKVDGGRQEFATTVGGVSVWLCHSVSSFFGFKRERYELIARYSCQLFDAESRYSDDRARILFKKVSSRASD